MFSHRLLADFKNPNDPDDKSFEPEAYPTAELEYPNTGAIETYALHVVSGVFLLTFF